MKNFKLFVVAAVATVALASCGGSSETPTSDTATAVVDTAAVAPVDTAAVVDTTAQADTTKK